MQLFSAFVSIVVVSVASVVNGAAVTSDAVPQTHAELLNWLATTDAQVTFVGKFAAELTPLDITVTYCNRRTNNLCGGDCTVYVGGQKCLNAPDTQCLGANHDVSFCDRAGCGHSCNALSSCGTRLDNGFCFTPGTASINVPVN
ncbi:hypothetical protein EUX98_g968 [Antrodiella citrinella]|uniref:Uncharacterized protein n=1 Tax=Antrodiella citrinella TaxID=2447956 RepID=A0A4V3XJJ3_9APHY|nr:hypothetical protein EUX98_g968 [Antrodiella citrinella]